MIRQSGQEIRVGDTVELMPDPGSSEPRVARVTGLWANSKAPDLKLSRCNMFLRPKVGFRPRLGSSVWQFIHALGSMPALFSKCLESSWEGRKPERAECGHPG